MPFFSNFSRKSSCSHTHILSKIRLFSKNKKQTALKSMFHQKNVHSLKNTVLSCHLFSSFLWKTPCCQAHIWSKKRQICQNYTIFWVQKVNRMPLFSDFHGKIICSNAHILQKHRSISKKHLLLCPYFVQKTSILTKTNCSQNIFFKFFIKNPRRSCPYLVKNSPILSKFHIMDQKVNRMSFFIRFFLL